MWESGGGWECGTEGVSDVPTDAAGGGAEAEGVDALVGAADA